MRLRLLFLCLLLLAGFVPVRAMAQSGGGYDLSWWTVDGGGYTFSSGGSYTLGGTVGQPDAGGMIGGGYTLIGGFWEGTMTVQYLIYLPLVLRDF